VNAGSCCRTATTPVDASAANEPPNRPARGVRTRECSGQAVQGLRTQSALRCSAGRGPPHALHSQRGRRHRRWGRGGVDWGTRHISADILPCLHVRVPACKHGQDVQNAVTLQHAAGAIPRARTGRWTEEWRLGHSSRRPWCSSSAPAPCVGLGRPRSPPGKFPNRWNKCTSQKPQKRVLFPNCLEIELARGVFYLTPVFD
jgi:hypothetical protein